ncbi:Thiol-disulfide isomerase or thioredoxin [Pedobacter steynii]|uniref:Thiol-disulfide isomerase or thioredoxin n=1 Tax=Pedobacter steynii TaxID=430522 RepID=A0A1G9SQK1_9SPHI|nr:thioredoxin-like domain-containing protein [Pedobacter steynii]NQX37349.1 redoxin family protein [Pedobacter steynii]SDM37729.1 Thiol-disulfide isomerase or thioredoxin [Pedobacter steynii]
MIKKILYISIVLLSFTLRGLGGQNHSAPYNNDFALISLKSSHTRPDKVYFLKKQYIDGKEQIITSVSLNNGLEIISLRVNCTAPSIIYATYRDVTVPIYIDKGAKIGLYLDFKKIKPSFDFSGSHSSINKYLTAKKGKLDSLSSGSLKDIYSLPTDRFELLNETVSKEISTLRNKYLQHEINHDFEMYDIADMSSLLIIRKVLYPEYHHHFTKEKTPILYDFAELPKDIPFNNKYGLLSRNFRDLLSMYMDNQIRAIKKVNELSIKEEQLLFFDQKLDMSVSIFKNKEIAEFFSTQILINALDLGFVSFFEERLKKARIIFQKAKYLDIATRKFQALGKIGRGSTAPNFQMEERLTRKKISLASFKGSSVFINLWSQGCHSSIEELENINRIAKQFEINHRIVFLNILIDNNLNGLNNYIKSNPLLGTNVVLSGDAKDFLNNYFINSLPRYILIDKLGKIIDPFAERPSSPLLIDKLKESIEN